MNRASARSTVSLRRQLGPRSHAARDTMTTTDHEGSPRWYSVLSYLQAIVIGFLQGFSELFPVSSLGHSVLVPAWLGWHNLVELAVGRPGAGRVLPGLHRRPPRRHRLRLAVVLPGASGCASSAASSPACAPGGSRPRRSAWAGSWWWPPSRPGIVGLALEHKLRTIFAKPVAAAVFLMVNGLILIAGERLRRRDEVRALVARSPQSDTSAEPGRRLDTLSFKEAGVVGVAQVFALLAGISRSGHHDGGGPRARPRPRGRRPVLVPPGDADHPGRRALQDPRPDQARPRHLRPDPGRQRLRGHRRLHLRAIPGPLVPDPDPVALRRLLPGRRSDQHRPLRLASGAARRGGDPPACGSTSGRIQPIWLRR